MEGGSVSVTITVNFSTQITDNMGKNQKENQKTIIFTHKDTNKIYQCTHDLPQ